VRKHIEKFSIAIKLPIHFLRLIGNVALVGCGFAGGECRALRVLGKFPVWALECKSGIGQVPPDLSRVHQTPAPACADAGDSIDSFLLLFSSFPAHSNILLTQNCLDCRVPVVYCFQGS